MRPRWVLLALPMGILSLTGCMPFPILPQAVSGGWGRQPADTRQGLSVSDYYENGELYDVQAGPGLVVNPPGTPRPTPRPQSQDPMLVPTYSDQPWPTAGSTPVQPAPAQVAPQQAGAAGFAGTGRTPQYYLTPLGNRYQGTSDLAPLGAYNLQPNVAPTISTDLSGGGTTGVVLESEVGGRATSFAVVTLRKCVVPLTLVIAHTCRFGVLSKRNHTPLPLAGEAG